ncbi:MAG: DUF2807 domain-containing protein [Flavobacterium sp.]|nr:DUF2807 domain-containing protein [Flavobacterium sp.]
MGYLSSISRKIFSLCIVVVLLASCQFNGITGSGNVTTEKRNVEGNFTAIEAGKGLDIVLEQSQDTDVTVVADDNLQKHITTKVSNGVLIISSDYNSYRNVRMKKVIVKMPSITRIEISSGAHFTGRNTIKSDNLAIESSSGAEIKIAVEAAKTMCEASSGGHITIQGKSIDLESASSGGSSVDAEKLIANNVLASASSGGNSHVFPLVSLNAKASSGGSINYHNVPTNLNKKSSSGGSINKE